MSLTNKYSMMLGELLLHVDAARGKEDPTGLNFPPKVRARAAQILRMEILLDEYRAKHATPWEPLSGIRAAHQCILTKYQWSLPVIQALSVEQMFLALLDDLRQLQLPAEALAALKEEHCADDALQGSYSDFLETEWRHTIAAGYLPNMRT